jgi:tetratricopeptide (TPR) repeat protein
MHILERGTATALGALTLLGLGFVSVASAEAQTPAPAAGKIPITTSSEEARQLYLKGRDLAEKLRFTDSRKLFEAAAAKDASFALAQVGLANTSGTAKEFFEAVGKAVALTGKVSEPERLIVQGLEAGAKGEVVRQKECYTKLTAAYPSDARGFNLLGGHYFGQQDYPAAIAAYTRATVIDPSFSQPYNQLGYAYRFTEKYPEAEQAFKKYIELIPGDPNPYDSYAELLMKTGRFEESIKNYEKALSLDPNFVASYIGIGNNQMFMGRGADARKTFARLTAVARNDGEKRQALFWTAVSYVHEGSTDLALAEVQKEAAIAEALKDGASLSADLNLMGNILLEAGQPDAALAKFAQQADVIAKADVPPEVKEAARRNALFSEGRVALAKKDIATAKAKATAYGTQVAIKKVPFEVRLHHELLGQIALEEKNPATAVAELEQANQQDPRVLYLLAVALQAKGESVKARAIGAKAADFNGLAANYAYVRTKAKGMLAKS